MIENTGCSFIDNLSNNDYEHNSSFFYIIADALRHTFMYLYSIGIERYTLMDNSETNLYFVQILENALFDAELEKPKLYLFSPCKDYVWEKSHESKAVKLIVDEVVYIRKRATNDPAVFDMTYQAVINESGILFLMDKNRDSEYYKYAVKKGKTIYLLNPVDKEFTIENVRESRGCRNLQKAIFANSDIEREHVEYERQLEREVEKAFLVEMRGILQPKISHEQNKLLSKQHYPKIASIDEKCNLLDSIIQLNDETINQHYWNWKNEDDILNDLLAEATDGKQGKIETVKSRADNYWKILKQAIFAKQRIIERNKRK